MLPELATQDTPQLEDTFHTLAQQWKEETEFLSSTSAMCSHAAYRSIIDLGKPVVPFLLLDLQEEPIHWFEALREITGEDPVPREHWGNILAMRDDWLAWGHARGLI